MAKVYLLKRDTFRKGDLDYDAYFIKFKDSGKLSYYLLNSEMYKNQDLPDKVLFRANFNVLVENDYPLTNLNIPVMSENMFTCFKQTNTVEFKIIDLIMIDDTFLGDIYNSNDELTDDMPMMNNYVSFSILEKFKDYLNLEKSDYRPSRTDPKIPSKIRNYVLNEPETGFPSIFRLKYSPSSLFISEEAKETLESNNIKGCVFEEVETASEIS